MTVSPTPRTHVLQPGAGQASKVRASANVDQNAPVYDVPSATSAGLIIIPTFNAAAIEATINTAIATIESQFSDPITVYINFYEMTTGLGQSQTWFANLPYSTFLSALKADARTGDDAVATSLLPSIAGNPVNGQTRINVNLANLRAVGFNTSPTQDGFDGQIGLNTTITSPGSPSSSGSYYLLPVVLHEIDEVLGLGSALPSVPLGTIFPEDLYRYSAVNTRTFTTVDSRSVGGVRAYFSIDASNFLAEFNNQNDGGDFGDWQSRPRRAGVQPKVQDESATPGANPAMSVELTALDVIGYDRVFPPVVTANSVTPSTGTGATQTFALAYGDTAGATDLQQTWVWFNPTFASSSANSCLVYYDRGTNLLNLLDDAGAMWLSAPLGSGTLQNSQCAIALASSTAVPSGNTLTLTLAVTFAPKFVGTQTIFMYATNGTQMSGWQTRGTWMVPAIITADSVTPNAGTGATQTFALAYGDTAGATDLHQTWVWFNPTFGSSSANSCLVYYDRGTNLLYLVNDAGTAWLSAPLGSGTLQNSQCAIALAGSTAVPSGNTLTLTLAFTFTSAFAGAQNVYMFATNGTQSSGWQPRGTWTVPATPPPVVTADSVTPDAGTGATQTFTLAYGDTAGAADLHQTWVWFDGTFASSASNSCLVYYDLGTNLLYLINDAGTAWLSALLGSGTLQNSQCAIALASSTVVPGGNTLTLTLALTFAPKFTGPQTIFMYATNGAQTSGWQTRGTWTAP